MPLPTNATPAGPSTGPVRTSAEGKPIGPAVASYKGAVPPSRRESLVGKYVALVPLDYDAHRADLVETLWKTTDEGHWNYMPYSHPQTEQEFNAWLKQREGDTTLYTYTILASPVQLGAAGNENEKPQAVGVISFMRLDLKSGVIEIGHVLFSPLLQRTRTSTEAVYLLLSLAFESLTIRRVEWKADNLNQPSKRAAQRFGMTFEGIFRKHSIYKARARDTAWFAMVDDDWPIAKAAFEQWLDPANFDVQGKQMRDLISIRQELAG